MPDFANNCYDFGPLTVGRGEQARVEICLRYNMNSRMPTASLRPTLARRGSRQARTVGRVGGPFAMAAGQSLPEDPNSYAQQIWPNYVLDLALLRVAGAETNSYKFWPFCFSLLCQQSF